MNCIVGLGNPESRYSLSRHNIGFRVVDRVISTLGLSYNTGKGEYLHSKGMLSNVPVLLIKPLTFMNRSGIAITHVARYYKISFDNFLIVHDDIDLPIGKFRFRSRGSDGGNKGLRSIIAETGTEEIARLRIGIRNREIIANPSRFVLSNFNRKEQKLLPGLIETAEEAVKCWTLNGIRAAMNRYNRHHDFV